jgi:hypothetical protein
MAFVAPRLRAVDSIVGLSCEWFPVAAVVLALTLPAGAADKPVVIPEWETITGRCVGVNDGDTMTLLTDTPAGPHRRFTE